MSDYREISAEWWGPSGNREVRREDINAGSLQRIADACEAMSENYKTLIEEREWYHDHYREATRHKESAMRSLVAMRGVVTKLKNRIADLEGGE